MQYRVHVPHFGKRKAEKRGTYEQVGYTEKQANSVASVTSGLRSPTKTLKWPG